MSYQRVRLDAGDVCSSRVPGETLGIGCAEVATLRMTATVEQAGPGAVYGRYGPTGELT